MNETKSILKEILLPWQQSWVADRSRFKIGMWSRQTGKSFSTACEAVTDSVAQPEHSSSLWVVLSAGERQALEWMEKAKKWSPRIKGGWLERYARFVGNASTGASLKA